MTTIALSNFGTGTSYYRVGKAYTATAPILLSVNIDGERALLNTGVFSNPTAYAEATGAGTSSSSSAITLLDAGAIDYGLAAGLLSFPVTGSSLTLSTSKSRLRSSALSLNSGDRFITNITTQLFQTTNLVNDIILMQFHP